MKKMYMLLAVLLLMVITNCKSGGDGESATTQLSSAKTITAFSLNDVVGTINETGKTIAVAMPYGTSVINLVATYTITGTSVKVGSTVQVNGTTANNFTSPVTYTVTAADASTQDYIVTVTVASGGTWTQKADFGGGTRSCAVGFSIGSMGYIGPGNDGAGNSYKDFWEYDPSTNTWTQKADFGGTARHSAVGFSIGSMGYIGTGYGASGVTKDFWQYDPNTNTWTQKADFGGTVRDDAVGFSIGSMGYIGPGYDPSGITKDFWEYNP